MGGMKRRVLDEKELTERMGDQQPPQFFDAEENYEVED